MNEIFDDFNCLFTLAFSATGSKLLSASAAGPWENFPSCFCTTLYIYEAFQLGIIRAYSFYLLDMIFPASAPQPTQWSTQHLPAQRQRQQPRQPRAARKTFFVCWIGELARCSGSEQFRGGRWSLFLPEHWNWRTLWHGQCQSTLHNIHSLLAFKAGVNKGVQYELQT